MFFFLLRHFRFRLHQIGRMILSGDRNSMSIIIFSLLVVVTKFSSVIYYILLFVLPVFFFQLNRRDIYFIKKIFAKNWWIVISIENVTILLFFSFINVNYKYECYFLIGIATAILFSLYDKPIRINKTIKISYLLPCSLFEWKSYIRKNRVLIIIFYPLFLISAYNSGTLLIGLLFIMDPISRVFQHNESKEMLEFYFTQMSLIERAKKNIFFLNKILMPVYAGYLYFNVNFFYIIVYYIIFINLYFLLIFTRKYSLYSHKESVTYVSIGLFYEYTVLSMCIIPAILQIKKNIKNSNQIINCYVRNPKC